ncbi:hypothetical protein [Alsobacter sp. R-9]
MSRANAGRQGDGAAFQPFDPRPLRAGLQMAQSWLSFAARRWQADMRLPRDLAETRGTAEALATWQAFVTRATDDYTAQVGRSLEALSSGLPARVARPPASPPGKPG